MEAVGFIDSDGAFRRLECYDTLLRDPNPSDPIRPGHGARSVGRRGPFRLFTPRGTRKRTIVSSGGSGGGAGRPEEAVEQHGAREEVEHAVPDHLAVRGDDVAALAERPAERVEREEERGPGPRDWEERDVDPTAAVVVMVCGSGQWRCGAGAGEGEGGPAAA